MDDLIKVPPNHTSPHKCKCVDSGGLKFDSNKPRWELLPAEQLVNIVRLFNSKDLDVDLKKFDREEIINDVFTKIFYYKINPKNTQKTILLSLIAFRMFYLLRGRPYTDEELNRSTSGLRWDLIDMGDVEKVVEVYTLGAKKYMDNNWKKVSSERYYDALLRHFSTIRSDNKYDSELGCLHLHQSTWNAIALMWMESQIPMPIMEASRKVNGLDLRIEMEKVSIPKKAKSNKSAKKIERFQGGWEPHPNL